MPHLMLPGLPLLQATAAAGTLTLWIALGAGVVSFLSPCVLPVVPTYLSYLTGLTFGDKEEKVAPGKVIAITVLHTIAFIIGFSVVFLMLGLAFTSLGKFWRNNTDVIMRVGGVLLILFGLHIAGAVTITGLQMEAKVHLKEKPAGLVGSFVVGVVFSAGWSPCIGPILGSILTVAAMQHDIPRALALLGMYSLGMAVPFLVSALLVNSIFTVLSKVRRAIPVISLVSGILLVLIGFVFVLGKFGDIQAWFMHVLPVSG
jgi:cytochrome c-type biogenesis protein